MSVSNNNFNNFNFNKYYNFEVLCTCTVLYYSQKCITDMNLEILSSDHLKSAPLSIRRFTWMPFGGCHIALFAVFCTQTKSDARKW